MDNKNSIDISLEVQRYQMGLMTPDEEVAFEHAVIKSSELQSELQSAGDALSGIYDNLAKDMPLPRKALKRKILDQVEGKSTMDSSINPDAFILRATDATWVQTNIAGIEFKILYTDEDGRSMLIARLAPGASLPSHRRLSTEECLVLSGDFWADGQKLTAGDFIAGLEGNEPDPVYTEGGCELLLKLLIPDEIVMN